MESASEYMANKHLTLVNDYRTPDGRDSEWCGLIAADIAERLLTERKSPEIRVIQGKLIEGINRETLIPKPFEGRVTWGAHQVCFADGKIYDPMVDTKPLPVEDYLKTAFEDKVEMEVLIPQTNIKEFIRA